MFPMNSWFSMNSHVENSVFATTPACVGGTVFAMPYQNLYDEALISPMYTVFKPGNEIDHGFLFKLLKTEHYRQIFAANTNASVDRRGSLRWGDFKKIEIPLPSMAEQAAISGIIDSAQLEIESFEKQLDRLKVEKCALMQQLLTGKRRVHLPATEAASA